MRYVKFDNAWILEHYSYDSTWVELCNRYNEEHGTEINYSTFKYHCNKRLNLRNSYHDGLTKEQEKWLIENYPKRGVGVAEEFNERFGTDIRANTLKVYCNRHLNLKVTNERLCEVRDASTKRLLSKRCHPIGTEKVMGDMGLCVKTVDGWKRLSWIALGIEQLPRQYKVIHLDGDIENNAVDNLKVIDAKTWGLMSTNKFWSKEKIVTETGIVWCELHDELKRSESKWQKQVL